MKPKKNEKVSWYARYRNWAEKEFGGDDYQLKYKYQMLVVAGGGLGLILYRLLPRSAWFYLIPPLGVIAALDAWGAARHRGNLIEAWVRALLILGVSAVITLCLWAIGKSE